MRKPEDDDNNISSLIHLGNLSFRDQKHLELKWELDDPANSLIRIQNLTSLSSKSEGFEQCWKGIRIGIKTLPVSRAALQIHKHGCQRTRAYSFPLGQYFDHGGNFPENATYQSTLNPSELPTPGFGASTHCSRRELNNPPTLKPRFKFSRQQIRVWS